MKQNKSCFAPGAGGGAGGVDPFSRSEALSSAGFGLVSRAVMLPLRALMYYCFWLGSSSLPRRDDVASVIAFGERDVVDGCRRASGANIAGLMARCSSLAARQLCYARCLPISSYRGRCQIFIDAA